MASVRTVIHPMKLYIVNTEIPCFSHRMQQIVGMGKCIHINYKQQMPH